MRLTVEGGRPAQPQVPLAFLRLRGSVLAHTQVCPPKYPCSLADEGSILETHCRLKVT